MERESYYFLLLLIGLVICIGVFWFQFNNANPTYMVLNATEVPENGSFSGVLNDAYGFPVANKTITFPSSCNRPTPLAVASRLCSGLSAHFIARSVVHHG